MGEATVTCVVPLSVARAYALFVEQIDRWWVRDRGLAAVVRFEGDRLVEATDNGATVLANVTALDPPHRIELGWSGPHAEPGDSVVVDFRPASTGTRVTVVHRREGLTGQQAVAAILGLWWGDLLNRMAFGAR